MCSASDAETPDQFLLSSWFRGLALYQDEVTDPAADVLAGILNDPDGLDHLLHAVTRLTDDHFSGMHKALWRAVTSYYEISGGVLGPKYLSDLLSKDGTSDPAQILLFKQTFADLYGTSVTDHEFRYAVSVLRDRYAAQLAGEAITTSFEILQRGAEIQTPQGLVEVRGHQAALDYVTAAAADIQRGYVMEVAPEGPAFAEGDQILADIEAAQSATQGVQTGIGAVDDVFNGYVPGELGIVAAFTNAGKTQMCAQTAWHASVMQGRNVFFATSETVREAIRLRVFARHSRLPQFKPKDHVGEWRGLNAENLKNGDLTPGQFDALKAVIADLKTNSSYGSLYIAQVPRAATLTYVETRMKRVHTQWQAQGEDGIGLAVVDYLGLLKPERRRTSEREEMNEILKDAKTFAVGFDNGHGVPLLSPWQMSREAHNNALNTGHYTLGSLSDTSEAEKSPDTIVSLFREPGSTDTLTWQFLKMRSGHIPEPVTVKVDFRNAYFGSAAEIQPTVVNGKATMPLSSLGFDSSILGI